MAQHSRDILAFSHIPKTAGTTLSLLLQQHFGWRHMAIRFRRPPVVYTPRDLTFDLKLNPFVKSISGHSLKPFINFGELESRLRWYTILREPRERFISHYQHYYNKQIPGRALAFHEWMRTQVRQNWMVRMIAGEEDVEAAKQIIDDKIIFVGLVEKFNESLLLFRSSMGLCNLNIDYPEPVNAAKSIKAKQSIINSIDSFEDEIRDNNKLDIMLYDYVKYNIWSRQIEDYGVDRLNSDLREEFRQRRPTIRARYNKLAYGTYRNLVYKPVLWYERRYTFPK